MPRCCLQNIILGVSLLFPGLWGCLPDNDCDAKPIPIEGSLSDYTLQAGEVGTVTLHAPMACPQSAGFNETGNAHFIALEGKGDATFELARDGGCQVDAGDAGCRTVSWDLFVQDTLGMVLRSHPTVRWLVAVRFGTQCEPQPPITGCRYNLRMFNIHTNDWRITNSLVEALRDGMEQQGLGECVGVLVSEIEVACPS